MLSNDIARLLILSLWTFVAYRAEFKVRTKNGSLAEIVAISRAFLRPREYQGTRDEREIKPGL